MPAGVECPMRGEAVARTAGNKLDECMDAGPEAPVPKEGLGFQAAPACNKAVGLLGAETAGWHGAAMVNITLCIMHGLICLQNFCTHQNCLEQSA